MASGYETLLVEAALAAKSASDATTIDVKSIGARLDALATFSKRDDFASQVLTFKRAANIIRKQGSESDTPLSGVWDDASSSRRCRKSPCRRS